MKHLLTPLLFIFALFKVEGQETTLYQVLYDLEDRPTIIVDTDFKKLQKLRRKKSYQPAKIIIKDAEDNVIIQSEGEIKVRGHRRKEVCRIPPVKFNFSKEDIAKHGLYDQADKLKFVFTCSDSKYQHEQILKEYLVYKLFEEIEPEGIQTRIVNYEIRADGNTLHEFAGILLEDEESYAFRKDARIVEEGKIVPAALDRTSFVRMLFFQYMIANTDWAIKNKHNIEMVKLTDRKVLPLAYDFDYAGFVGQDYALPHESLPITSIHDRYFFKYKVSEKEYYSAIKFYKAKRPRLEQIIDAADYLSESTRRDLKKYIAGFYQEIHNEEDFRSVVFQ